MNTRPFLFSLLLVAMSGAQAQSLLADVGNSSTRPLNLSQRPAKALTDEALIVQEQAAQATGQALEQMPTQLPYGAGFENRQLGSTSGNTAGSNAGSSGRSGGSGGSGGSGNGGGGRGGSGRGR
ncbi:MAG: hypothetical protein PHQ58_06395 [Rhodoferax sp.]|uniref:hypothetical protein n=1 Tax=Rhodoferax sp. TaxID=50421 RepID=UPI002628565A|nr:hypothetical protein [Rhodoferax sp.]MDD2880047.1 hypothetical protein [Rhodoferax sp.]